MILDEEKSKGFFANLADKFKNNAGIKRTIASRIQTELNGKIQAQSQKHGKEIYFIFKQNDEQKVVVITVCRASHAYIETNDFKDILYSKDTAEAIEEASFLGIDAKKVLPQVEETVRKLLPLGHFFTAVEAKKSKLARLSHYIDGQTAPVKSDFKLYEVI